MKSLSQPLPHCTLWKVVTVQPTWWTVLFLFLLMEYLHTFLDFFYKKRFVSSPPSNLFSCLFISVWVHGYLFYILINNPILLTIFAQIISPLAIGNSFIWLLYHQYTPIYITPRLLLIHSQFGILLQVQNPNLRQFKTIIWLQVIII